MSTTLKEVFEACEDFRRRMTREKVSTPDEAVMLASQLAYQAQIVFEHLGGDAMVAKQFYSIADEAAGRVAGKP